MKPENKHHTIFNFQFSIFNEYSMSEINEEEVQNNSENKNIKQQPQVIPVIDHRLMAGKLTVNNWMEDTPE